VRRVLKKGTHLFFAARDRNAKRDASPFSLLRRVPSVDGSIHCRCRASANLSDLQRIRMSRQIAPSSSHQNTPMNRRHLLQARAGLALSAAGAYAEELAETKPRVGLIGCGWYGKIDLLRLIQVAPVEVVSLCDVDKKMLAEAADIVAGRQASKKKPRTFGDYRAMLKEKDLDLVLIDTPDH